MTKQELYEFLRQHKLAVLATITPHQRPEAALIGIAVTPELELVFDTIETTRKCQNLRSNPKAALVVGWESEVTLQYEGQADEPKGNELVRCKAIYFEAYPDGRERERWPGITYFRVRLQWARYSDHSKQPAETIELSFSQ